MNKPLYLATALLLAAGTLAAQPTAPAGSGKAKIKTKAGRTAAAPAPAAAPVAATDWSLPYAATITPAGLKADLTYWPRMRTRAAKPAKRARKWPPSKSPKPLPPMA